MAEQASKDSTKLSLKEIKALCTGTDIDRLAMIGVEVLLGSDDRSMVKPAAARYNPTMKDDSFRRSISDIVKKLKETQAEGMPEGLKESKKTSVGSVPTKLRGKKRKVAKDDEI